MQAGHQHRPGRSANGAAGIMLRKPHALLGHSVKVGGHDVSLPVTAQVAVAKIVGKDIDYIGLFRIQGAFFSRGAAAAGEYAEKDGRSRQCRSDIYSIHDHKFQVVF